MSPFKLEAEIKRLEGQLPQATYPQAERIVDRICMLQAKRQQVVLKALVLH